VLRLIEGNCVFTAGTEVVRESNITAVLNDQAEKSSADRRQFIPKQLTAGYGEL